MTVVEAPKPAVIGPQVWPLSVKAYHALSDLGLMPEKTELLYGQVLHKTSKSPLHRFLSQRLLRALQRAKPPGGFIWQKQPLTCQDSEPEPDLSVICGNEDDFFTQHPTTAELVIEVCVSSRRHRQTLGDTDGDTCLGVALGGFAPGNARPLSGQYRAEGAPGSTTGQYAPGWVVR